MTPEQEALVKAAVLWWEARRPHNWDEAEHLNMPKHRTVGCIDEQLAIATAEYVRSKRHYV